MNNLQRVRVDLTPDCADRISKVYVKRGDIQSREVVVDIYSDNEPYIVPAGTSVRYAVAKRDGTIVVEDVDEVVQNTARFTLSDHVATDTDKGLLAELWISSDGGLLKTDSFIIVVNNSVDSDGAISDAEIAALESALAKVDEVWEKYESGELGGTPSNVIYADNPPYGLTAMACDGITDDTEAFQALINYAHSIGGATIQLPRGEVKITSKILWRDGVSLVGAGMAESTLVPYGTNFSAIDFDESEGEYGTGEDEEDPRFRNIIFSDFGIDGINTTAATEAAKVGTKGIFLVFLERVVFRNLYIRNTIGTGLGVDELRDCLIENVHLYNCGRLWQAGGLGQAGIGIGTGGMPEESLVIRNCVARECGHYGIFVELQDFGGAHTQYTSQKIIIEGCVCEGCRNDGFNAYFADDLQIIGCRSTWNARNGFSSWGAMNRVIISDSIFAKNGTNGIDVASAIVGQNKENFIISGCIVDDNGWHGVNINNEHADVYADLISICDCHITNNGGTGVRIGNMGRANAISLDRNIIGNNGAHGVIWGITGDWQSVTNCDIYGNGTGDTDAGFYASGGVHGYCTLANNRIHGNKVGMRMSGDATWTNPNIHDNINATNDVNLLGSMPT